MTTAVFDTLKASRKLKAAGIDEAQAEAIVQSIMLKTAIAVVVANVSLTVALIKLL